MTNSDMRLIRKRIDPALQNFRSVYCCYVNAAGEIVSTAVLPIQDMIAEEREMYSSIIRKTTSGPVGKHLLEVGFSAEQVEDSDEHRLLMALRESHLENEEMRQLFFERVIESLDMDGKSYAILLVSETYDLAAGLDEEEDWSEESETQFEYFMCSICPVKDPKAILRYDAGHKAFKGKSSGSILAAPVLGFMFPSFTDKQADIYAVAYYTKSTDSCHTELIEGLFGVETPPMPAEMQKLVFGETLAETLGDECSLDVVTSLQARISARIGDNEGESAVITPEITIEEVGDILRANDVSEAKIGAFVDAATDRFGSSEPIPAENLLQKSAYRITSSEASISVAPEQGIRIKTTVIDGVTYFLVPVGSDVRVNGVEVSI